MSDTNRYSITLRIDAADNDAARRVYAAVVGTFCPQDGLREAELIAEAAPNWTRVDVLERDRGPR